MITEYIKYLIELLNCNKITQVIMIDDVLIETKNLIGLLIKNPNDVFVLKLLKLKFNTETSHFENNHGIIEILDSELIKKIEESQNEIFNVLIENENFYDKTHSPQSDEKILFLRKYLGESGILTKNMYDRLSIGY